MPRRKRSYLPGCAFHITARSHNGEFWPDELRTEIVEIIALGLKQTDAVLHAFAVMTNHIHLVLRQGEAPLSQLMHPVCQRTAYAVHRAVKRTGYVMGYRYFDTPSIEESHLRNAILYTHRNPVEALMCADACDYEWSSHRAYLSASPSEKRISALYAVNDLFASGLPDRTPQQDYADFYVWYDACKKLAPSDPRPYAPGVTAGDEYWLENFGVKRLAKRSYRPDLRDVVIIALAELAPTISLDALRVGLRTRPLIALRQAIIERALRAGHRPIDVARYLNTSDSTVSRVNVALARKARRCDSWLDRP
ncbi:MAG: hypothetical protein WEE89_14000 [Gemmatimonadota bacterium]